jgi:hypothetical protein
MLRGYNLATALLATCAASQGVGQAPRQVRPSRDEIAAEVQAVGTLAEADCNGEMQLAWRGTLHRSLGDVVAESTAASAETVVYRREADHPQQLSFTPNPLRCGSASIEYRIDPDANISVELSRDPETDAFDLAVIVGGYQCKTTITNAAGEVLGGTWGEASLTFRSADAAGDPLRLRQKDFEPGFARSVDFNPSSGGACAPASVSVHVGLRYKGAQACDALKRACERAKRWRDCMQAFLTDLLHLVVAARAEGVAEEQTNRAAGNPVVPGALAAFLGALDRFQSQVLRFPSMLAGEAAEADKDCAALPGPEDRAECAAAASRVETGVTQAAGQLRADLARDVAELETASSTAATSLTRTKLLADLGARMPRLELCSLAP